MTKRNPSRQSRANENRKRREELKQRAKRAERKRLGLEDNEDEALIAGPIRRYFAFTFDLIMIVFVWVFLLFVELVIAPESDSTDKLFPAAVILYGAVFLIPRIKNEGRSFGRSRVKIEVTRLDGKGFLTWQQSITRWIIEYGLCFVIAPTIGLIYDQYVISITLGALVLFGIIVAPALFTEYRQGIHEMLSGSVTVRYFPDKRKFSKK